MDSLPEVVYVLLRWRFTLSVVASIMTALVISSTFPWFTAGYCITLALFGVAFGLIWQGRSEAGVGLAEPAPHAPISRSVACLGFAFVGFFWGGVASFFLHSVALTALSLVLVVVLVGLWYQFVLKRKVSKGYFAFAAASLLIGYLPLALIKFFNT